MSVLELVEWFAGNLAFIGLLYGIIIGWLLRDRKHDIVRFFRENGFEMFCWTVFGVWPVSSIVLFWVNVLIFQNALLMYGILGSMVGYLIVFGWVMWEIRKEKKGEPR